MGIFGSKKEEKKTIMPDITLVSLVYILAGVVLTINPIGTVKFICFAISGVFILMGLIRIIRFLTAKDNQELYRNDLVLGIILLIIGIVFSVLINMIVSVIIMILGVSVLVSGLFKLQSSFEMKRMKEEKWISFMIIALVNIALGLFLASNPFQAKAMMIRVAGICILISGLTDFIAKMYVSKKFKEYQADMKALEQEGKWK